ncbi:hypothetical protein [Kangiella sp. TOML190]|uniref:hypothetical protein n=1 Tax=Kangiella sp. TOML190 TaxID=2931351 RepID=UPI00203DC0A0|nr:hypothetical protein [Kangiella sp. TOML190]
MKNLLIGLTLILIAAVFFYFTKPNHEPAVETNSSSNNQPLQASQQTESALEPEEQQAAAVSCNSQELNEQLNQLKEERNEQFLSFVDKGADKALLERLARERLQDYSLVQQLQPPQAAANHENPFSDLFNSEEGRKLSEDLMLAAMAGQADEYAAKFRRGELYPLDPDKAEHRDLLLSTFSMGGEQATLTMIEQLYPEKTSLSANVLPAIFATIKDETTLRNIIKRVANVNLPIEQKVGIFGSHGNGNRPLDSALQNQNFTAAQILLDFGAKPRPEANRERASLDLIYQADEAPPKLLTDMLNRGFTTSDTQRAERLAQELASSNPQLSTKFELMAQQLAQKEQLYFEQAPPALQNLITDYQQQQQQLNQEYMDCLAEENQAKPTIPPYQPINKAKIEADIDRMVSQKVKFEQIIAQLAAFNKETVQHAYQYLRRLRLNKVNRFNNFQNLPPELRQLILLYKDKKWNQMVKLMETTKFPPELEISPATMLPEMIQQEAPESAIAAMVKISDKNDIKLIRQAQFQPKLLERIAGYGFNLDAKDNSNKNLFYQVVTRGQVEKVDTLLGYGVSMVSDPFGYDPLDALLRNPNANEKMLAKLQDIGFPITAHHQDYALYLKEHYPKRYQKLIEAIPDLEVTGKWQPKSP